MRNVIATLVLLLCSAAATAATCDWSEAGRDKYTGSYEQALGHYQDIAPATRAKLLRRMNALDYDDIVTISDTSIVGRGTYEPEIWGMHWGVDRMCMHVVRPNMHGTRTALVYTEDGMSITVPSDCNNIARLTRLAPPPTASIAPGPSGGDGGGGGVFVPGGAGYAFERPEGLPPVPVAYSPPSTETPPVGADSPPPVGWLPYPVYIREPGYWYPIAVPTPVAAVPEPATWATMALGVLAIAGLSYWRHRRAVRTRFAVLKVLAHAAPKGLYAGEVHLLMNSSVSLLSVNDALHWLQRNKYTSMSIMRIDCISPEPAPEWQTRALNYIEPAGTELLNNTDAWDYADK